MLIYLHGTDSFLAKEAINSLKQKYLAKNPSGSELIEISADDERPNWADLRAIPLFATSRLIIIRRAGELNIADQDNLASMLTFLPDSSIVALWDSKTLKPNSALWVQTHNATKKIDVEPLTGVKLTSWIKAEASELGQTIAPEKITALIRQYGSNLWAIQTDLMSGPSTGLGVNLSEWGETKSEKPFILFDDVRAKRWDLLKQHLINAFNRGEALELTIGSLAAALRQAQSRPEPGRGAAVRQSISDESTRRQIVSILSDIDLALKTGLIEAGDAVALLVYYLPDGQNRLQWEDLWQTLA